MCIFFLTFKSIHLIKGTQARTSRSVAQSDVKGESIDEERNEEKGACEEEGCPEEKEVAKAGSDKSKFDPRPREIGAVFLWRQGSFIAFASAPGVDRTS